MYMNAFLDAEYWLRLVVAWQTYTKTTSHIIYFKTLNVSSPFLMMTK